MSLESVTTVDEQIEYRSSVVSGVLIALLGLLAIAFPFVTGLSIAVLLGALLVIGGLVHVAHAFSQRRLAQAVWQVVLGVLYGIAGITFLANPVVGLATLTLLAIAFFLVDGLVEIIWALQGRAHRGWTWLLLSGIVSILLAGLLWTGFPSSALWAVGVLLGVNLLFTGVSIVVYGRTTRETTRPTEPSATGGQRA